MPVEYPPCPWTGPDGRRCLLYDGHPPLTVGHGHLPDRAAPPDGGGGEQPDWGHP
jgi:hypothetical protein